MVGREEEEKINEIKQVLREEKIAEDEIVAIEERIRYFFSNREKLVEYLRILNELKELQKKFMKIVKDFELGMKFFRHVSDFLESERYEDGFYILVKTKNLSVYFDEEGNLYVEHEGTPRITLDKKGNIILM